MLKPSLGKQVWSLMTPGHLFVGLTPRRFYSKPIPRDNGGAWFASLDIGVDLNLKTGRIALIFANRAKVQTLLWERIRRDSYESVDGKAGNYYALSTADPLTRKVIEKVRKFLIQEAYDDGEVLDTWMNIPKGMLQYKGDVLYFGYKGKVTQVHSLDQIHRLVLKAVESGRHAWSWSPRNLKVFCHPSGNGMGLAYNPGKGAHAISLHTKLLREYDANSVYRVILHELCHHHREETWPRKAYTAITAHDQQFCNELSKVDEVVAASGDCRYFQDEQWMESAAVQKKIERKHSINWSPDAGYLVFRRIKSGYLRLDWLPRIPGDFPKKTYKIGYDSLKDLLSNFSLREIQRVEVLNQMPEFSSFGKVLGSTTTLAKLMDMLTHVYPRLKFDQLLEVLK